MPAADPAVAGGVEEPVAVDHGAARLGEGRDAELHPLGDGAAVPGRVGAAFVFAPDAHPGEVGALPAIAKGDPGTGVTRQESGLFKRGVQQIRGIGVAPGFRLSGPECELRDAGLEKRRSERDVLRPCDRAVVDRQVLHRFEETDAAAIECDSARERQLRGGHHSIQFEPIRGFRELVIHQPGLAMGCDPGRLFSFGRRTEEIQTQVMADDASQQARLGVAPEIRIRFVNPRRYPKRADACGEVGDFGDMAAGPGDGDAQGGVLYRDSGTVMKASVLHL